MRNRTAMTLLLVSLSWFAGGCVYSEKGLAIPGQDDSIFDPWLIGEWEVPETGRLAGTFPPRRIRITRADPKSNAYSFIDLPEIAGHEEFEEFQALRKIHLFRLGDCLFLDIREPFLGVFMTPHDPDHPKLDGSTLPHAIVRMRTKGERFVLEPLNEAFFKANPEQLPHRREGDSKGWIHSTGRVRITATTEELRAFLAQNASNDAAWSEDRELFIRVETQASAQSPQTSKP